MAPCVAGVDGARGAWVVAIAAGDTWQLHHCETFAAVAALADARGVEWVGVDMPIGLPATGPRAADIAARALLGPRRSSLFPTPSAAVLDAHSYDVALARSRAATGKGLSKQAFHLLPMIRQVRAVVSPAQADRFFETHPETTFTVLAGEPLPSKKTAAGVGRRLGVLADHCDRIEEVLAASPPGVAVDDVLDAVAAAISARRFALGVAEVFGADAGTDETGYPLRIIA